MVLFLGVKAFLLPQIGPSVGFLPQSVNNKFLGRAGRGPGAALPFARRRLILASTHVARP
jgi:hypothetical protein